MVVAAFPRERLAAFSCRPMGPVAAARSAGW